MKDLLIALRVFVVLTVVTGVAYPLLVTGIAQTAFRDQANGSLIKQGDKIVGSRLIGQDFQDPKYFWGRPSSTSPTLYNAAASSGSNLSPTNPALKEALESRVKSFQAANPGQPVPTELVTASASGLDPDISPQAAAVQIPRIAKARGIEESSLKALVEQHTQGRQLGLGEPRVNVLELNLALDHPQE